MSTIDSCGLALLYTSLINDSFPMLASAPEAVPTATAAAGPTTNWTLEALGTVLRENGIEGHISWRSVRNSLAANSSASEALGAVATSVGSTEVDARVHMAMMSADEDIRLPRFTTMISMKSPPFTVVY